MTTTGLCSTKGLGRLRNPRKSCLQQNHCQPNSLGKQQIWLEHLRIYYIELYDIWPPNLPKVQNFSRSPKRMAQWLKPRSTSLTYLMQQSSWVWPTRDQQLINTDELQIVSLAGCCCLTFEVKLSTKCINSTANVVLILGDFLQAESHAASKLFDIIFCLEWETRLRPTVRK